jgi:nucleoid DNA-binding protein
MGNAMKTVTTVTKKDLVDRIAERTGNKRVIVKTVIQDFLNEIVRELGAGNRLEFRDFGVFETRERAPRVAQNPKTMEKVPVPRKRTVKFKVGRLMRQQLERGLRSASAEHVTPAGSRAAERLAAMPSESTTGG